MAPHGHPNQQIDDSYGLKHTSIPGDAMNLGLRRMQEAIEVDQKLPVHGMQVGQQPSQSNMNIRGTDGVALSQSSVATLPGSHETAVGALSKEHFSRPQLLEGFANDDAQLKSNVVSSKLMEVADRSKDVKSHEIDAGAAHTEMSEKVLDSGSTRVPGSASNEAKDSHAPPLDPKSENVNISSQVREIKLSPENTSSDIATTVATEVKGTDVQETKKAEKKKKQKKKQAAADAAKGASKTVSAQQPRQETEVDNSDLGANKHDLPDDTEELFWGAPANVQNEILPPKNLHGEFDTNKAELEFSSLSSDPHTAASQRAWKQPTQGLRPKSLLEIQAEEQQRAQKGLATESAKPAAASVPSIPWNGMATSSEQHYGGSSKSLGGMETAGERNRRSQLHDLLAEEVLARSSIADSENIGNANDALFPPLSPAPAQPDAPALDDNDFIEAKDKKNKKKATKTKASTVKAPSPVGSFDPSAISVPTEKGKAAKQAQQESEILPAPPSGPSFGDFVLWKSDQASSVPAPAWSSDSAKVQKPLSLRDIQREQERRSAALQQQAPSPTPPKVAMNQKNHGNASSWQASGSSPSKAVAPVQMSSNAPSHSKSSTEDDLFWGPSEHSKQDKRQSEFPTLSSQSRSSMTKDQSPANRQKSQAGRVSSAAPANTSGKGKAEASNKQTEAMDFRDWCEGEWVRLTGTNDISFLEFCIKQSTLEAETLLRENIGSLDRNHQFIDKFLNYKAFLSSEVIDMAFQAPSTRGTRSDGADRANPATAARGGTSADMELDGGGKKKGKKGKKVSAAVLGFNVVSNRIMMGEIQNVD